MSAIEPSSLKLWTLKEAAAAVKMSERTLKRLIEAGKLRTSPVTTSLRIPNDEVLRLAGRCEK